MKRVNINTLNVGDRFKKSPSAWEPYYTVIKTCGNGLTYAESNVTTPAYIVLTNVYVDDL